MGNYNIINGLSNSGNLSIESIKQSIDELSVSGTHTVCILGDIPNIEGNAQMFHYEIGEYAYQKNINVIVCVGIKSYNTYEGASKNIVKEDGNNQIAIYFENIDMFAENLEKIINKGDTILVCAVNYTEYFDIINNFTRR